VDWSLAEAVRFLTEEHPALAFLVLFGSAIVEYVFPPFPGDTVTLAGAVLVTGYGYPFAAVFAAVLAGGLVGAAADYWVGARLARIRRAPRAHAAFDRIAAAFARHGEAYVVVNRFLPGVRAFIFVAAGLARMRFWRVMLWSALSGAAWNLLVILVGMAVGSNLETIERLARQYSAGAWIALAGVAIVLAVRWWIRRRRRGGPPADA